MLAAPRRCRWRRYAGSSSAPFSSNVVMLMVMTLRSLLAAGFGMFVLVGDVVTRWRLVAQAAGVVVKQLIHGEGFRDEPLLHGELDRHLEALAAGLDTEGKSIEFAGLRQASRLLALGQKPEDFSDRRRVGFRKRLLHHYHMIDRHDAVLPVPRLGCGRRIRDQGLQARLRVIALLAQDGRVELAREQHLPGFLSCH